MKSLPEILAPISDWDTCRAAVHNGADAVYVGVPGFNARGRAPSLSTETLQEIINFCHLYGVKVFLALNVLIFEEELQQVADLLRKLIPLSPDAFIVQDLGLVRLLKYLAPKQEVHASTQMTVTSAQAVELTEDLDISRYVLGREVSLKEMKLIREATTKELEVFVHGALCVSYSGQCLTSERIGGRSANRGQCAQSCRWPYDLIVDGEKRELGDKRYLVSPKDLCALDDVEELRNIGIDSFKIEGRLKSAEYVASTVGSYFEKINALPAQNSANDLSVIYSRGFFNGWMDGVNHQELVDGRYPSHQGQEIGKVISKHEDAVLIASNTTLSAGDGLLFCDFQSEEKIGGFIFECKAKGSGKFELKFSNEFPLSKIKSQMNVFLNSSTKLEKRIRRSFTDKSQERFTNIDIILSGALGERLKLSAVDDKGNIEFAESETNLLQAENAPLTEQSAKKELSALSGSSFRLHTFSFQVKGRVFVHNKELRKLKQRVLDQLRQRRQQSHRLEMRSSAEISQWLKSAVSGFQNRKNLKETPAKLNVLVRNSQQLQALSGLPLDVVYLDYEFGKDYRNSIDEVRALGFKAGIATTRILKPGENNHLKYLRKLAPDLILVRNLGALRELNGSGLTLVGDFSLNVANSLTAGYLLSKGLSRLCPSYDLNRDQLHSLFESIPGNYFEVTVHQYMPSFHMEHCVFAAFLSKGTSYRDCGKPCEKFHVELRAPDGAQHPLKADAECRNTMFNGVAQSAAILIPELRDAGVECFRIEALNETPTELRSKIELYAAAIIDKADTHELLAQLNLSERYGVSDGQLLNIRRYKDRVKELRNENDPPVVSRP